MNAGSWVTASGCTVAKDSMLRHVNGGPIYLDSRKVIEIDEARAWKAYLAGRDNSK